MKEQRIRFNITNNFFALGIGWGGVHRPQIDLIIGCFIISFYLTK